MPIQAVLSRMFIKAYSPGGQFLSVVTIRCRPTGHSAPGTQYPLPLSRQRLTPPPDTPSANHVYNIPRHPIWHYRVHHVPKPRSRIHLSRITPPGVARGCCARGRISKIFRRTCPAPNPLWRCALLRARYTRRAARRVYILTFRTSCERFSGRRAGCRAVAIASAGHRYVRPSVVGSHHVA